MVELGFVTQEEQELFAILLDQNMYGNIDVALCFFKKYSKILVDEKCRAYWIHAFSTSMKKADTWQ